MPQRKEDNFRVSLAKTIILWVVAFAVALVLTTVPASSDSTKPKQATAATKAHNAKLLELLPFATKLDIEDATSGLIAPLPNDGAINNDKGQPVWDLRKFQECLAGKERKQK